MLQNTDPPPRSFLLFTLSFSFSLHLFRRGVVVVRLSFTPSWLVGWLVGSTTMMPSSQSRDPTLRASSADKKKYHTFSYVSPRHLCVFLLSSLRATWRKQRLTRAERGRKGRRRANRNPLDSFQYFLCPFISRPFLPPFAVSFSLFSLLCLSLSLSFLQTSDARSSPTSPRFSHRRFTIIFVNKRHVSSRFCHGFHRN